MGAAESKVELAANSRGVPFITLHGRRGGSRDRGGIGECVSQGERAMTELGRLYGLGIGPGDPELLTLKAHRI